MTDKYNGWTNYETWLCKLWMDNDGDEYYSEMAQEAFDINQDDANEAEIDLSERLQAYWNEMCEQQCPQTGFFADLINAGLKEVNWREIAESYLDQVTP